MTTRVPENLTQIDPHRRRRIPAAALPEAEEEETTPTDDESRQIPDAPFFAHAARTPGNRRRWNFPACVMETIPPSTVAKWDAKEDEIADRVVGRRVIVTKYDRARSWERVGEWDDRDGESSRGDPKLLTEELLRSEYGPGSYTFLVYFVTEDENGEPEQRNTRTFKQSIGGTSPRAAQPATPPPPHRAPVAPSRAAPPGEPPQPGSFSEWVQFEEMRMRAEERAEERRARTKREEEEREERRARLAREEEERQERADERRRLRQREDDDRREREEEKRRTRAREDEERRERDEERRERKSDGLERKLLEMKAQQLGVTGGTPLEQLRAYRDMVTDAKGIFADGAASVPGSFEKVMGMLGGALEQHGGKLIEFADNVMTGKQRIAELEMRYNALIHQLETGQPVSTAPQSPPAQRAAAPNEAPPPSAESAERAAAEPIPEDELVAGDPCPDCGKPIPCDHFDAPATSASEEDADACKLCPPCPKDHTDADLDVNGDCTKCGPCPHVKEQIVETSTGRTVAVREVGPEEPLPPFGGFTSP